MKVEFKQTRVIDGQAFHPGTHVVPDALADHWFFKAILADGSVVMLEGPETSADGDAAAQAQLHTTSFNAAGEVVSTPLPNPDAVQTTDAPAADSAPAPEAAPDADVPAADAAPDADVAPAEEAVPAPAPEPEPTPAEDPAPEPTPEPAPDAAPVEDAAPDAEPAPAPAETDAQPVAEAAPATDEESQPVADAAPANDTDVASTDVASTDATDLQGDTEQDAVYVEGEVYDVDGVKYVGVVAQEAVGEDVAAGDVVLLGIDQLSDDDRAGLVASGKLTADEAAAAAPKKSKKKKN